MLESIGAFLTELISSMWYTGIFIAMFVENLFPPIPSELIMPFAGYLVYTGQFNFWLTVFAGWLGTGMGTLPLYSIGYRFNKTKIINFFKDYGKYVFIHYMSISHVFTVFERYGTKIVFIGRFIPVGRSLLSIPAWCIKMNFWLFSLYTIAGSMIWSLWLTSVGYLLGSQRQLAQGIMQTYGAFVYGAIILTIAYIIYRSISNKQINPTEWVITRTVDNILDEFLKPQQK